MDLVVIDESTRADGVTYYPAASPRVCQKKSWRKDMVPRLLRQQRDGVGRRELRLAVLIWNGFNHFDAAVSSG